MKIIGFVSVIILLVFCSEIKSPISDIGSRFIDEILKFKDIDEQYILVLTPSQCEDCIFKCNQLIDKIANSKKINSFLVISSSAMISEFKYKNIKFKPQPTETLQRYGYIGNLGVLYNLNQNSEEILHLDAQPENIKIIKSYCK